MNQVNKKFVEFMREKFNPENKGDFLNGLFIGKQKLANIPQGTKLWEENRIKYPTCSQLAKILGLDPNCSKSKYARIMKGLEVEVFNDFSRDCMRHGMIWEPCTRKIYMTLRKFGRITDQYTQSPKKYFCLETGTFKSNKEDVRFTGSPDGIYFGDDEDEPILIEIKNPAIRKMESIDCVDAKYLIQVLSLMGIMNLKKCDFIYMKSSEAEIIVFRVDFNQEAFDYLNDRVNEFITDYEIGLPKSENQDFSHLNFKKQVTQGMRDEVSQFITGKIKQRLLYRGPI